MLLPTHAEALRFSSDEAWLQWRSEQDCVGGSEVPKLLGLSPYTTPIGASSASAGHILEPLVLARAARIRRWDHVEQGWCVRQDWRRGSLDAVVFQNGSVEVGDGRRDQAPGVPEGRGATEREDAVGGPGVAAEQRRSGEADHLRAWAAEGTASGPDCAAKREKRPVLVVEIKVVFLGQFKHWRDGLPDHVLVQALWYMSITGLPVVVVALLVPAWGIGTADPETLAECSEIRFYELTPAEHGERAALVVDAVREVRAGHIRRRAEAALRAEAAKDWFVPAYQPPPAERTPEGTFDDGVLAARWLAARSAVREAAVAARDARRALRAAEAGYDAISERLRSRVGSGESLLAGGWRISVGKNGAIRVR